MSISADLSEIVDVTYFVICRWFLVYYSQKYYRKMVEIDIIYYLCWPKDMVEDESNIHLFINGFGHLSVARG